VANWTWELRSRGGGMNGLEFALALTAGGCSRVLVHAAPAKLRVHVRDDAGTTVARGEPALRAEKAFRAGLVGGCARVACTDRRLGRRDVLARRRRAPDQQDVLPPNGTEARHPRGYRASVVELSGQRCGPMPWALRPWMIFEDSSKPITTMASGAKSTICWTSES